MYCPTGTNCLSYSQMDMSGYRTADLGVCETTAVADPVNGVSTCDLTNGELIADRTHTCVDIDPDFECVLIDWGGASSWGTRIGQCADLFTPTGVGLWDPCNAANDVCPAGSLCLEEDAFAATHTGVTRCIPYCDTENGASCNAQHSELPISNVCTSVSFLFVDSESSPSRLGMCACPASGC